MPGRKIVLNAIERMSYKLSATALLVLTLCATSVRADDSDAPMFSFSGFGTLGETHSSENKADFNTSLFKPGGAGYGNAWSAGVDSLIGAQVTANFTPQLSAVLQVVSAQIYDGSYRP